MPATLVERQIVQKLADEPMQLCTVIALKENVVTDERKIALALKVSPPSEEMAHHKWCEDSEYALLKARALLRAIEFIEQDRSLGRMHRLIQCIMGW